ncbi:predicted protein [Postia placenta Mad-698-R]|nr:predicted protein [Postia placenta Mad-698-R]
MPDIACGAETHSQAHHVQLDKHIPRGLSFEKIDWDWDFNWGTSFSDATSRRSSAEEEGTSESAFGDSLGRNASNQITRSCSIEENYSWDGEYDALDEDPSASPEDGPVPVDENGDIETGTESQPIVLTVDKRMTRS